MSSSQRSSSGVRNLRAVFENNGTADSLSPNRGTSPSGSNNSERSPGPPITRKVRASFVPVEPKGKSLTENNNLSNRLRPGMTSEQQVEAFQNEMSGELDGANDVSLSASVATPLAVLSESGAAVAPQETNLEPSKVIPNEETQSDHPEKTVSAVVDQDATLLPVDVTGQSAANAQATSVEAVGGRGTTGKIMQNSKPAAAKSKISQAGSNKPVAGASKVPSGALKSPSQTSPLVSNARSKSPTRQVRLSQHLTQPTASFAAKHEPQADASTTKPRSPSTSQKSMPVSSNLMAPTAASKAKHEQESAKIPNAAKPSRPRPSALPSDIRGNFTSASSAAKQPVKTARASLAHSTNDSQSHSAATKAPSEGFLTRMTKPTSASSSRIHEKTEVKSAPVASVKPRQPAAPKPAPVANKSKENIAKPSSGAASTKFTATQAKAAPAVKAPVAKKTTMPVSSNPVNGAKSSSQAAAVENVEPVKETIQNEQIVEPVTADQSSEPVSSKDAQSVAKLTSEMASTTSQADTTASEPLEEWNPAALPQTPEMKREEAKAARMSASDQGRRSMMETPDLAAATIH